MIEHAAGLLRWPGRLALLCVTLLAMGTVHPTASAAPAPAPTYVYAQTPCTPVYASQSTSAPLLTQLIGGSELTLVAADLSAAGTTWDHVTFWSGLDGWVPSAQVGLHPPAQSIEGQCSFPGLSDTAPHPLAPNRGPWPLNARGHTLAPTALLSTWLSAPAPASPAGSPVGFPVAEVTAGAAGAITAWAADDADRPWYDVTVGNSSGWLPANAMRLDGDPATQQVNGAPIWRPIAGKGMWFVNYLPHHSDVNAMVQAAQKAGLTHLYAEVAVSTPQSLGGDGLSPGFYGQGTLDRLLPAAHAAGIKVIGTVYVALDHVATDARLSAAVAQYRTPSGDRVDGLAADIEANIDERAVYSYGQVLRAELGPDALLVANVLHPLAWPNYPFEAIAASWNVISPMDYWHDHWPRTYTAADTTTFVAASLTTLRAAIGSQTPVEELGQMYDVSKDTNTEDGTGGSYAPTAAEIVADLRTARRLGCIGVTFYQWPDATQSEWQALSQNPW